MFIWNLVLVIWDFKGYMIDLLKRERIYIWMVIFILGFNLFSMGHTNKKGLSNKKSISSMTFQNMGITEERVRLFFESKKPSAIFFKYSFIVGFFMLIAGIVMDFIFLFIKKEIITEKISEKKSVSWGIMDIIRVTIIVIF